MRLIRVARFLRGYFQESPDIVEEDVRVRCGDGEVDALLYRPLSPQPAPAWVVLHGVTVLGRRHLSLNRFCRAMAAAGNVVIVPEVPVWTELRMETTAAARAVVAGADYLRTRPEAASERVGVVGFSVGATQGLIACADPTVAPHVRGVVAFGGYCDLHRTLRCMCTGEHEWQGRLYRLDPDPYGRWIVAGNHLTQIPDYRGMDSLADGLRALAAEAGRRGVMAYDASFDELKAELRAGLSRDEQRIWDVLAHPSYEQPDPDTARQLASQLADAALAADPALDPRPAFDRLARTVVMAHGREDRLIPFTETLRMRAALGPRARASTTITSLFAHSTESGGLNAFRYTVEAVRFVRLLSRALHPGG
jgi:hypothetical protein